MNLVLQTSKPFTRDAGDGPIDPSLAQKLFAVKQGEAATGRTADGAIVARVTAITPAKPEESKDKIAEISKNLANTMRKDLYAEFLFALGQEVEVVRNDDVIQKMIAAEQ